MSEELRECPFCGGADVEHLPDGFGNWLVGCVTCDYRIQCVSCTEEEAIRYWNTRPAEDALKAENERLKKKLIRVKAALIYNKNLATGTDSWVFGLCDALIEGINYFLTSAEKGGEDE